MKSQTKGTTSQFLEIDRILESTASEALKKYIADVYNILLSDNLKELTDSWKSLVEFIILLSGKMGSIDKFPVFYKDILKGKEDIDIFVTVPEISEHKELVAKLNMIRAGIELYAHSHGEQSEPPKLKVSPRSMFQEKERRPMAPIEKDDKQMMPDDGSVFVFEL
jgi:hypothetical protein